jgi:branched-chain amino acid transport system permease protein
MRRRLEAGASAVVAGLSGSVRLIETLPERLAQGSMEMLADVIAGTTWRGRLLGLAVLGGLATLPDWAGPRLMAVMIAALWLAYASQAWNIVSGFAGQLSLGHALFVGLGAYLGAGLCLHAGIGPWLGLWLVIPAVALAGTAVGALALRTGWPDVSFALLTLAAAEACRLGADHLDRLGGAAGLVLPPPVPGASLPDLRDHPVLAYYLILALTLGALVLTRLLLRSGLGYRWLAARENPTAAAAAGVNLFRTRLSAMTVSAALTAPAGVFLAFTAGTLLPDQLFSATSSMAMVLGAVIGGLGTFIGPLLGALMLAPVNEALAWLGHRAGHPLPGLTAFCYGLLLVLMLLLRPGGLWPWLAHHGRLVPPALPAGDRQP